MHKNSSEIKIYIYLQLFALFYHLLFKIFQLDNSDEQAACIRRELHSRQKILTTLSKEVNLF